MGGEKSQNLCPETIAFPKKSIFAIKSDETARRLLWILMGNVH